MPWGPIPFVNKQASGLDPLGGAGVVAMNVVMEMTGAVRRRPGLVMHSEAPSSALADAPVTGLHATEGGDLFAVLETGAERGIYRVKNGVATLLGGGLPPRGLRGTLRPVFAETEALLVIAGGDKIEKIELDGYAADRLGGDPPEASHVVANASRLVANELEIDRSKLVISGTAAGTVSYAGHEQWSVGIGNAGFVSAEARPDPVVALAENTNEVFTFGTSTLQVFSPDAALILAPVSTRELGCAAPYSVIKDDQRFAWLDQRRRFVVSDGRSDDVISDPIKATLDAMSRVDDCFGYRVVSGVVDAYVWTFPSDGRTFVFQKGAGWGQWQGFDTAWTQFPVTSHTFRVTSGRHVVGLSDGRIAEFDPTAQSDLGAPINAYILTGYENRDTDNRKHCRGVQLSLRRGETQSSSAPVAFLCYRDRPGAWQARIPVSLGYSADTEIVVRFRSLGTYRRRQWGFDFNGPEQLVLLSATEEYEVLEI